MAVRNQPIILNNSNNSKGSFQARLNNDKANNEIRVASHVSIMRYVNYALRLIMEDKVNQVTMKATGNAIPRAIMAVELLKERLGAQLEQQCKCGLTHVKETYESSNNTRERYEKNKPLCYIEIFLTSIPTDITISPQPAKRTEEIIPEQQVNRGGYFRPRSRYMRPNNNRYHRAPINRPYYGRSMRGYRPRFYQPQNDQSSPNNDQSLANE